MTRSAHRVAEIHDLVHGVAETRDPVRHDIKCFERNRGKDPTPPHPTSVRTLITRAGDKWQLGWF